MTGRGRERRGDRRADRIADGSEVARGSRVPWSPRVTIGLLMALNLFFCLALFEPKIHTGGDSANYVTLAESVLRVGDGYADSMAPGAPVPHTKYPPGYPLLLAPFVAIFGRSMVALKLVSVGLTVSSVLVFALLAKERTGERLWLPISLAFAVNPVLVDYSRWLLSEAPFLLCTVLALLFLERDRDEPAVGRYFWLALFAIVATYYVRSIGVVFLVAGTLYYLIRRDWRRFAYFNVVGAGLSLPWFIRNQVLSGEATPYIEQFLLKSVYEPEAGYHDVWGLAGRVVTNVGIYSTRELPRVLAGSDSAWSGTAPMKALAVGLSVLVVLGFLKVVWSRLGMAEIYFALSCLAVLLFEEVVSDVRYLMPLLPFILLYAVEGLDLLAEKASPLGRGRRPAVVTLGVIATVGALAQMARVPENVDMLRRYAGGDRLAGYHPAWRSFFVTSEWIAANTPQDAVVTVRKPRLFHLLTGRRIAEYPFTTDTDSVLSVVLRTDYVLVDQISGTTGRYLVPAIERAPDRFRVIYRSDAPPNFVLEVIGRAEEAR